MFDKPRVKRMKDKPTHIVTIFPPYPLLAVGCCCYSLKTDITESVLPFTQPRSPTKDLLGQPGLEAPSFEHKTLLL